ncbi:MAG: helix-turn-helix transcriptional regulator [Chloroflexi bacterium]|nr:helix-turn-helix transcriptional regulator [Chloroflexota bacterium]
MLREFFLGFAKIHILHHAARESVYGLQLIEELRRHGYHLSPGTLYPVLHGLEKSGYLTREDRLVGGKIRKYYRATPLGQQALREVRAKIEELVAEVLRDEGPGKLPEAKEVPGTVRNTAEA